MNTKTPEESAFESALRLLAAGDKTCRELKNRLERKAYPAPVIETVLERLQKKGFLNDAAFAAQLVDRLLYKSAGKKKIAFELARRGFAGPVIAGQLERLTPETEQGSLEEAGLKQWRRYRRLDSAARQKKVFAFLARSGFESGMIRAFLERLAAGTGQEDEASSHDDDE